MKIQFTTTVVIEAPDVHEARVRYDDLVWRHYGQTHSYHLHRDTNLHMKVLEDDSAGPRHCADIDEREGTT